MITNSSLHVIIELPSRYFLTSVKQVGDLNRKFQLPSSLLQLENGRRYTDMMGLAPSLFKALIADPALTRFLPPNAFPQLYIHHLHCEDVSALITALQQARGYY